jgi:predicted ATPase/DNA-binding CsgD family transcriptional regulator
MPANRVRSQAGNLPAEVTSFIGRRREAAELKRLLETSRLVALTGAGGVGKTRLALKVAREVHRAFPDGVWFVDLSPLQDPGLVAGEVGVALGLRDHSGRWPVVALSEYLADKQLLLVLDNCEHVLDACALLLADVLRAAPDVRVLATSRQPLGITGEHVLALAALSLPDPNLPPPPPEAFPQYEALTLFAERAQAAFSTFTVTPENHVAVVELCRSLDGVPLAIELAAVRVRLLSPEQIRARLDERFLLLTSGDRSAHPRQRSLHALIDWSFELCSLAERVLWMRLAVFPGGFDLDAAAGVCADDDLDPGTVLNALAGLVDRSLLVPENAGPRMRYRTPETVRQFALARLADSGEETALRRRHRDYFQRLADQADAHWCGPEQRDWATRLAGEHDNLRAALAFSLTQLGEERAGLDLAATLRLHWFMSGYLREGRQWLERALAAVAEPCRERAKGLWADAYLRLYQGDVAGASSQLDRSRQIAEAVNDPDSLAHAFEFLGAAALLSGDWATAAARSEDAVARHRALENRFSIIMTLSRWAMAAYLMGNLEQSLACHTEALAVSEECHEGWGRSAVLWMHGVTLFDMGDLLGADADVRESLRIKHAFGDRVGMAQCVEVLAWIAAAGRAYDRAARLLGVVQPLWRVTGGRNFPHLHDRDDRCRANTTQALGKRVFAAAVDDGARMDPDDGIAFALGTRVPRAGPSRGAGAPGLTRREREIAELVAQGLSNKDVAARLVISQRTAETHVENVLTKLGFSSRAQIAAWVAERRAVT